MDEDRLKDGHTSSQYRKADQEQTANAVFGGIGVPLRERVNRQLREASMRTQLLSELSFLLSRETVSGEQAARIADLRQSLMFP